MKILIAVDGSACSQAAVRDVAMRSWPAGSEFEVLTVVYTRLPFIPDPIFVGIAAYETLLNESRAHAPRIVEAAAETLKAAQPSLQVSTKIVEGTPKTMIVDEAEAWGADLIVLGAHGYGATKRMLLGSVSQAVALHAPCSVEIARTPQCLSEGTD
jgi:nucleotide-binding universal stress UspA family protein